MGDIEYLAVGRRYGEGWRSAPVQESLEAMKAEKRVIEEVGK